MTAGGVGFCFRTRTRTRTRVVLFGSKVLLVPTCDSDSHRRHDSHSSETRAVPLNPYEIDRFLQLMQPLIGR